MAFTCDMMSTPDTRERPRRPYIELKSIAPGSVSVPSISNIIPRGSLRTGGGDKDEEDVIVDGEVVVDDVVAGWVILGVGEPI